VDFHVSPWQVSRLIRDMVKAGFSIEVSVSSDFSMPDEEDRKFCDAAKTAGALLITGNEKHYPDEPFILTPAAFIQRSQSSHRINNSGGGLGAEPPGEGGSGRPGGARAGAGDRQHSCHGLPPH
jgi:hypothetical protein